jgi:glycerate kinase
MYRFAALGRALQGNGKGSNGVSAVHGRGYSACMFTKTETMRYVNMKKVVLIPDSFKETMSSLEICNIMKKSVLYRFPGCEIISIPVADGGEGSVDCFLNAMGGERVTAKVSGPFFNQIDSFYGLVDGGKTAVIEMAACAGLPLAGASKNPLAATTYGVGQLIGAAAERGCKKIILGLGGSCTNDGGCGAAAALGVKFRDKKGKEFVPTGGSLKDIVQVDVSMSDPLLKDIEIICMCDIDNPLFGLTGAAYVFAPQKGADAGMVRLLDEGLINLAAVINTCLGTDVGGIPGGGAAGGMGAGMTTLIGAKLRMGIQTVLDLVGFDEVIKNADLIFTGEGKIDTQSLRGKVVIGVARRAKAQKVPVIAVVGDIGNGIEGAYNEGVTAIFSINNVAVPFEKAKLRCREDMALAMDNIMRLISLNTTGNV